MYYACYKIWMQSLGIFEWWQEGKWIERAVEHGNNLFWIHGWHNTCAFYFMNSQWSKRNLMLSLQASSRSLWPDQFYLLQREDCHVARGRTFYQHPIPTIGRGYMGHKWQTACTALYSTFLKHPWHKASGPSAALLRFGMEGEEWAPSCQPLEDYFYGLHG